MARECDLRMERFGGAQSRREECKKIDDDSDDNDGILPRYSLDREAGHCK